MIGECALCGRTLVLKLGLCPAHYQRRRIHGDPGPAELLRAPAGVGCLSSHGYRRIRVDGEQVYEHRHVIETELGRPLRPDEHVHHANGNKTDNRAENLQVLTESEHMALHGRWSPRSDG